ncbi:tail assembly protein [Xenorhabdus ehlersii]|uniref:Phage tail protein n=1 Tax=Xenorhabdus ehlersii TaxID=290111 RepID=A0A2D0IPE7_9GAMM|nr:tail assembly protein [Xenorhabdus ehlersii]PHM23690.1 putative tail component of prophage [Xenorhabdus ehlersii]RKE92706.1 putative phage tail protein [Xenorhabdus ehlersii]
MVKLQLGGHLRRFGRRYELEVRDAAEAVRCLCYQLKGFQKALSDGLIRVRIAGRDMTENSIPVGMNHPLNDGDTVTIVPVVGGAGGNGVGMAILGVVAVAAAFYTGGASIAAWAGTSGAVATGLAVAGVALISAGLASMLTKMPQPPEMGSSKSDGNQYFNSLENRIGQGYPVPIAYGELVVGSNVISQGLETE